MQEAPVRLMLADDHVLVRQGLRTLLERAGFVIAGEAAEGREAVQLACAARPDIALLDINMPHFNGLNAAHEMARVCPGVKVMVLTGHDERQYVAEALRCGVRGYVLKREGARNLVQAIRDVAGGAMYLSPGLSSAAARPGATAANGAPLSVRERQVLQLVAEGDSTKKIAVRLGISAKTVESHRCKLMRKLDIHDTAGLVRYAIREGLTPA